MHGLLVSLDQFIRKKGSPADPDNYRAITIVSNLGKLFTSILNKRLNKYADNIELITKMQAGFRKYFYIAFTYFYLIQIQMNFLKGYCLPAA